MASNRNPWEAKLIQGGYRPPVGRDISRNGRIRPTVAPRRQPAQVEAGFQRPPTRAVACSAHGGLSVPALGRAMVPSGEDRQRRATKQTMPAGTAPGAAPFEPAPTRRASPPSSPGAAARERPRPGRRRPRRPKRPPGLSTPGTAGTPVGSAGAASRRGDPARPSRSRRRGKAGKEVPPVSLDRSSGFASRQAFTPVLGRVVLFLDAVGQHAHEVLAFMGVQVHDFRP